MIRLALVGSLLGCLTAVGIAWELRESVAYAEEPQEGPQDFAIEAIGMAATLCGARGDRWAPEPGGGRCVPVLPNLGVHPLPRR